MALAHHLLATSALASACFDRASEPYAWLWNPSRPLFRSGIVVSVASLWQLSIHVRQLQFSDNLAEKDEGLQKFHRLSWVIRALEVGECILPIRLSHLMCANNDLAFQIIYELADGSTRPINMLERLVLATAIVGEPHSKPYLLDYDQPFAFEKLRAAFLFEYRPFIRKASAKERIVL